MSDPIVVIGAGPAGLAAAYELVNHGYKPVVVEAEEQIGGLAKTVEFDGFRFDLGGHRFFTRNRQIETLWRELLGERLRVRPRLSRIFYRGKLFSYPLKPAQALWQLGPLTAASVAASYAWARSFPQKPEDNFEAWVKNRFGRKLYEIFFRTYTEKVWGMPCTQVSSDWASERIQDLSFGKVVREALWPRPREERSRSLIDEFLYPCRGPQEMRDELARRVRAGGGTILTGQRVYTVRTENGRAVTVLTKRRNGRGEEVAASAVISTMPLRDLALAIRPEAPVAVRDAATRLRFRAFLTVCLIVEAPSTFADNWIYVHSPDLRMGRLQNFGNWSAEMVPEEDASAIGLEYFAWQGDEVWTMPDVELVELGTKEFAQLGLMPKAPVRRGYVARSAEAYPVYDLGYRERVRVLREFLSELKNVFPCGRGGLHRYNNMDHSMLTGILAARAALGEPVDVWERPRDDDSSAKGVQEAL